MKEKTADIDILEELKPEKMDLIQLIRTFKREGIENFITIRREKFETLIAENKELKEEKEKVFNDGYMKGLKHQIIENWNNEHARIIKVKSQFVPISLIEKKIEDYKERKRYYEDENLVYDDEYYSYEIIIQVLLELLDERSNTDE